MNSHRSDNAQKNPDDLFDMSLRRSLQNWVDRKESAPKQRAQLLAAAQQAQEGSLKNKSAHFFYGWSLLFQGSNNKEFMVSSYNYALDSVYTIKSRMAVL